MRGLWMLALLCAVLLVAGCPKPDAPETGAVAVEKPAPRPGQDAEPEKAEETEGEPAPQCPVSEFGDPDSDVALESYVDLDGDGIDECVIGFQARTKDDVGEPVAPAYVELVKWDGSEWTSWFSVPAPGGETFVDEDSLAIAEDINEDGVVELGIQFYHFGVSSRRENLYLWQVKDGGVEPAVEGDVIESTSDDEMLIEDVSASFPGSELVLARALMGDEAHAEPHRYEVSTYAWSSGMYRVVDTVTTEETFADPADAIGSVTG